MLTLLDTLSLTTVIRGEESISKVHDMHTKERAPSSHLKMLAATSMCICQPFQNQIKQIIE